MQRKIAFIVGLIILAFCASVSRSSAQTKKPHVATMDGVTDHPVSREELARAILSGEDGDQKVLNTKSSYFVEAMNEAHQGLRLENRQDLAELIRTSEVAPCGSGSHRLSRVRKSNGTFDVRGWVRNLHPNEMCLWQGNRALLSLDCGNPILDLNRSSPYKPREAFAPAAPDTVWRERVVYQPQQQHDFFIPEERHHGVPWVKAGTTALGLGLLGYGVYALWPRSHHVEVNIDINKSLSALMSVIQ